MTTDDKKMPKNAEIYFCLFCDFECCKKSNYVKHMATLKHKRMTTDDKKMPKNADECFTCECGKKYNYRQGLWKHKKICIVHQDTQQQDQTDTSCKNYQDNKHCDKDELINYLMSENSEFKSLILEIVKEQKTTLINNTVNNNNKTFNLNVFLNEECKDAMNIMDFVDSLNLQLSDLENVGKQGFIDGISNIIVKNLKALDVNKRPVHCSDSKREIMYIKDQDKWEKENDDKKKLRKAIKYIAHKNSRLLIEFKEKYPDCIYSDSKKSDQYNKIIIEAMGGHGDNDGEKENKIIKQIAKEVIIIK